MIRASKTVGGMLDATRTPIIVFESTVYPGVTEDICAPVLEVASGLDCGSDFFLGYSPEQINPGDREHTIDKITKVVSGQNSEVLDKVENLYDSITSGVVFRAASIRAAEAAKVIENAQRDINWNFLPFSPGLVGGHCIGVDPYYLAHRAEELGHDPRVILSGRAINDGMADWVAGRLHTAREGKCGSVLVMGLTFKEDVPDLRNSKVADVIRALAAKGHDVTIHDPHADGEEATHEYGVTLTANALDSSYDLVLLAVAHREYLALGTDKLAALVADSGLFADLKNGLGNTAYNFPTALWHL